MADRTLKFALIGCGRVAEMHLGALTSGLLPAELAAVCDLDEGKARGKSEKYKVPYYLDYHRMLEAHPEVDVVTVATPTGYHARHVIDLARYGKAIVTEKPMALRVRDCDAMMRACAKHGSPLFVIKQNRFNPAVVAARRAFDAGRFGKLVMVTARVRWCRTQEYYESDNWHGTWALDGGVMSQQASHHLDLLQWFLGPVASVQCQTATRLMDIEVEDTALAVLKGQSGALGAFEATVAARPENMEGSLSILGEKGTIVIGGPAVNRLVYWKFGAPLPGDAEMLTTGSQEVASVYGHGHGPYLGAVVESIVSGRRHPAVVDGAEGRKNIQILTALYESAANDGKARKPGCATRLSKLGREDA